MTMRYLYGLAVDQIIARTSSSGVTAWYMTDQLGSVRDVVSTSGTVLDHIVYGSFGNIISQTNSSNGDRFLFTGMEYDATTGIYYDHARYYDPTTGRFVSQDPKGFAAGDANLYRYARNSPAGAEDPSGLQPPPANQWSLGGGGVWSFGGGKWTFLGITGYGGAGDIECQWCKGSWHGGWINIRYPGEPGDPLDFPYDAIGVGGGGDTASPETPDPTPRLPAPPPRARPRLEPQWPDQCEAWSRCPRRPDSGSAPVWFAWLAVRRGEAT